MEYLGGFTFKNGHTLHLKMEISNDEYPKENPLQPKNKRCSVGKRVSENLSIDQQVASSKGTPSESGVK